MLTPFFGWYSGRRHYRGPHAYVTHKVEDVHNEGEGESRGEKSSVDSEDKGTMH